MMLQRHIVRFRFLLPITVLRWPMLLGPCLFWSYSVLAEKPTRIVTFAFASSGVSADTVNRTRNEFVKALRQNKRLDVKDPDKLLLEFSGEIPHDAINAANEQLDRAIAALQQERYEHARTSFQTAIDTIESLLAFMPKRNLARAQMGLAIALAQLGKKQEAIRVIIDLFSWRPQLDDDPLLNLSHLPTSLVESAQKTVEERDRGSVELASTPKGARAFIDGKFVGVTPTIAFGIRAGTHYASFTKTGYIKTSSKIEVNAIKQERIEVALEKSQKDLLLNQALKRANKELSDKISEGVLLDLQNMLFVDQVLFLKISRTRKSADSHRMMTVAGALYDLRSKLLLNRSTIETREDEPSIDSMQALARTLYLNNAYEGKPNLVDEPLPVASTVAHRAWYKTWWFWTLVGAGAIGITLPIVVMNQGGSDCQRTNGCFVITN